MSTPHNEANLGDIAKTVIMPGDPLRAKYIAENFFWILIFKYKNFKKIHLFPHFINN